MLSAEGIHSSVLLIFGLYRVAFPLFSGEQFVKSQNKTTFLVQRSQDWILTNPFIIILSFFSYLVTFHFWRFPFLILSLPICHAVLVPESFLTWVFQSQRKNFLSPGLLTLKTWRPTRPFILSFSDQLFPCVSWWSFDSFFSKVCTFFQPNFCRTMYLVKFLESSALVLYG